MKDFKVNVTGSYKSRLAAEGCLIMEEVKKREVKGENIV